MVVIGTARAGHAEAVTRQVVSKAVLHSGATRLHVAVAITVHAVLDEGCGIPEDVGEKVG